MFAYKTPVFTLTSWNHEAPETVEGYRAARLAAEGRARQEGAVVYLTAPRAPSCDYFDYQTVSPDGRWSGWRERALPGSRSEIDEDEAAA